MIRYICLIILFVVLFTDSGFTQAWKTGYNSLFIYPYSTKIAIGTYSPRGRLDLGRGGLNNNLRIGDYLDIGETDYWNVVYFGINAVLNSSSISGAYNRFKPTYALGQGLVMAQSGGGQGNLDIYGINWAGNATERNYPQDFNHIIRFNYNGKVGIGTTVPTHELTVNGTIKAEEIIVGEVGADFVFEEDYKLITLEELEQFIKTKKRLPEIPPASEIQESGAKLGELQNKLLQKIEELTLYLIEVKKSIRQQKEQIDLLSEENRNLKNRISVLEKSR